MIVLIRHPPLAVAPGICYGRRDLALADPASAASVAQEARRRLGARAARVWTSPLLRCRAVADALGPNAVDARLIELDFGAWDGMAWDAIPRAALDAWAADPLGFAPPGGESGGALIARVAAFRAALPDGDHAVVAHGGPLKVLEALLRGRPVDLLAPSPPIGSVTVIG
ncbi:MAG: histidine phosphatase family protein [Proteobacteria bacterium]|nr:histidine phosphatase family protein [Pseudomonadota bacterium]